MSDTISSVPLAPETRRPAIPPETGKCFILRASTGCSCCRSDNFIEGPWRTREAAQARAEYHTRCKRLSSQYSDSGQYSLIEVDYERAGRWIILDGKYAIDRPFIEDDEESFDYEIDAYKEDYHL